MIETLIDIERLRPIGLTAHIVQRLAALPPLQGEPHPMRVCEVQRDALRLHDGEDELHARALPALLQSLCAAGDALAVGDWVLAEPFANGEWWVHTRVPPLTQLARRLHDGREKVTRTVIASNVDTALLLMGLDADFSLRRLERYLALARTARVEAGVVLSKADTCDDIAAQLAAVRALLPADVAAVAVDARSATSRDALAVWLQPGRTLVLLGSSGAGKSTLTNTLLGRATQRIGGQRKGDGRGRHTTTSRSLHVTAGGACLIDTPGLRSLRLDADEAAVAASFADIATLATQCRFRDCRHEGEPGCVVREQVGVERLRSWRKLLREAQRDTQSALQRREQLAAWKVRSRAFRARARAEDR